MKIFSISRVGAVAQLSLFLTTISNLRAVTEFTPFEDVPAGQPLRSDCTVTADGRFLRLWTAENATDATRVELFLSELRTCGVVETRSLGILGDGGTGSLGYFAFQLRIDTNGGKTWAAVRRVVPGTSRYEIAVAEVKSGAVQPVFETFIGATTSGSAFDLAVGDDGLPRVVVITPGNTVTVVRLENGGDVVFSPPIAGPDGENFSTSGLSLAVSGGQIAVSATTFRPLSASAIQSYLRLFQTTEPATYSELVFPSSSVVTTNGSLLGSGFVAQRQRSTFIEGSLSPAIIYGDAIDDVGKLAVRDPSLGWQTMVLPTIGGRAPDGNYVDIAADASGDAHLVWDGSSRPLYATFSASGSIFPQGELSRGGLDIGVATSPSGSPFIGSVLSNNAESIMFYYMPTDLTDADANGFSLLEEEAFGISPGNTASRNRAPTPGIFEAGDGRKYRSINFWRQPGGSGSQPYIVGDLSYWVESSINLKTWQASSFSATLAESFTVNGRGQFVVYRAPVDIDTINGRPSFFRVRVERVQ